jgi:hypothetical protein
MHSFTDTVIFTMIANAQQQWRSLDNGCFREVSRRVKSHSSALPTTGLFNTALKLTRRVNP